MLWLITQNKESLVNVKEVTAKGKSIEGIISSTSLDQWSKKLGKYESNERALDILNEIFMKIEESNGIHTTFRMPEK